MSLNGSAEALTTCTSLQGSIPCTRQDLNLDVTLSCGQSFRWKVSSAGEWTGVIGQRVYTLQQTEAALVYSVQSVPGGEGDTAAERLRESRGCERKRRTEASAGPSPPSKRNRTSFPTAVAQPVKDEAVDHVAVLQDYFRLSVDLQNLYSQWAAQDENFAQKAVTFTGVRMLRQDPAETLFSFICSSNNNIARISTMVDGLCKRFGEKLGARDGATFHAFPPISRLAEHDVEQSLRTLGFGYRAKYISQTAQLLTTRHGSSGGSEAWLLGLRDRPYDEVIAELTQLSGVGRKVADCVALMSLDKLDAVPVDTHVFQIAVRDYSIPDVKAAKSVTDKVYAKIGQHFRELYGTHAGWAHTILFSADLKKFKMLVK